MPRKSKGELHKEIFKKVWEDYYKGDLSTLKRYYDPNVIDHEAIPGQPSGLDGLLYHANTFTKAFSENEWTIERQVADSDFLVTRWTLRRKHTGDFMGIPATGKEVVLTGT